MAKSGVCFLLVLSSIELLMAMTVIISSFLLAGKADLNTIRTPFWAGFFFILPGFLGIFSTVTKSRGVLFGFTFVNIFTFLLSSFTTIYSSLVIQAWMIYIKDLPNTCKMMTSRHCRCEKDELKKDFYDISDCKDLEMMTVLLLIILASLSVITVMSFISSIIGVIQLYCNKRKLRFGIIQEGRLHQDHDALFIRQR